MVRHIFIFYMFLRLLEPNYLKVILENMDLSYRHAMSTSLIPSMRLRLNFLAQMLAPPPGEPAVELCPCSLKGNSKGGCSLNISGGVRHQDGG